MNFIGYLRVFIVGLLLLAGITGGVFSAHSCLMSTSQPACSIADDNDCCCANEPIADKTTNQNDRSCCKTITPYFNIPIYGVVKLIDINPDLIHCFITVSSVVVERPLLGAIPAFNANDPPGKLQGSEILIYIEKFLI